MAEKEKKRPDTPLAETPYYNMDSSLLQENLKKIQEESNKRRESAYAQRKAVSEKRKASSNKRGGQSGGSLQGLNTSLGGKIVR